jgi:hypothetical protein
MVFQLFRLLLSLITLIIISMKSRPLSSLKKVLFLTGVVALLLACHYYKPVNKYNPGSNPKIFDSLMQKTFIIHSERGIFMLRSMQLFPEREELSGILSDVPEYHKMYLNDKSGKYKYTVKAPQVLQEVHVFTKLDSSARIDQNIAIPFKDITRLEVIERDKGKSTGVTILAVVGITIGTMAIVTAIAAALKESCPFISVYDGNEYVLQGETFGGAIYPSLAREDFVPLPSAAIGSEVKVMVSNELKERQFTDFANLLLAEHAPGQQVLSTPGGNLMLVANAVVPKMAILNNSRNMLQMVKDLDNTPCAFNDTSAGTPVNRLVMTFDKPSGSKKLGLQLSMRNSYWLEYTFQELTRHFGDRYNQWVEQQKQKPGEQIIQWQESQHMPLTISIKSGDAWKEIMKIKTIGPLMNRDLIIPLDQLPGNAADIEVAFSTGFMFWEVDQVRIAEIEPLPESSIRYLKPSAAVDESGKNVMNPLREKDSKFLEQPEPGKRAYITYKVPDFSPSKAYSAFLHSSGYYEPIRDYQGPADIGFLNRMREPGAFTAFSMNEYKRVAQSAYLAAKKP